MRTSENLRNFKSWYAETLRGLYEHGEAGSSSGGFTVHSAKFAKIVIKTIEDDFATFEGRHSVNHPFPVPGRTSDGPTGPTRQPTGPGGTTGPPAGPTGPGAA